MLRIRLLLLLLVLMLFLHQCDYDFDSDSWCYLYAYCFHCLYSLSSLTSMSIISIIAMLTLSCYHYGDNCILVTAPWTYLYWYIELLGVSHFLVSCPSGLGDGRGGNKFWIISFHQFRTWSGISYFLVSRIVWYILFPSISSIVYRTAWSLVLPGIPCVLVS